MNLSRYDYDAWQSMARAWPMIEADIERVQEARRPTDPPPQVLLPPRILAGAL